MYHRGREMGNIQLYALKKYRRLTHQLIQIQSWYIGVYKDATIKTHTLCKYASAAAKAASVAENRIKKEMIYCRTWYHWTRTGIFLTNELSGKDKPDTAPHCLITCTDDPIKLQTWSWLVEMVTAVAMLINSVGIQIQIWIIMVTARTYVCDVFTSIYWLFIVYFSLIMWGLWGYSETYFCIQMVHIFNKLFQSFMNNCDLFHLSLVKTSGQANYTSLFFIDNSQFHTRRNPIPWPRWTKGPGIRFQRIFACENFTIIGWLLCD